VRSNGVSTFGAEAEATVVERLARVRGIDLGTLLLTSTVLQQDVLRHVLTSRSDDLFAHLSRVLGLEVLEAFEAAAKERSAALASDVKRLASQVATAEGQRRTAVERADTIRLQVEERAQPSELVTSEALSAIERSSGILAISLHPGVEAHPDEWSQFAQYADQLSADVLAARELLRRLPLDIPPGASDDQLAESQRLLARLEDEAREAARAVERESAAFNVARAEASEVERLVAVVLPLLSHNPDRCPVCAQSIAASEVIASLRDRASNSPALLQASEALSIARAAEEDAISRRNDAQLQLANLQSARTQAGGVEDKVALARSTLGRLSDPGAVISLRRSGVSLLAELVDSADHQPAALLASLRAERDGLDNFLARGKVALDEVARGAAAASVAATSAVLRRERSSQLPRMRAEVTAADGHLQQLKDRLASLQARADKAKGLAGAAGQAHVSVVRHRFDVLQPVAADIYARLDPHPAFTDLQFASRYFRAKGSTRAVVVDPLMDVTADPNLVMSSAQANIVALAMFLAIGWASRHTGLPFLLLDDPLQSMDDVNVLGFADLARLLRHDRQLIVATHERRYASLLERKLTPRDTASATLVLEFVGWSRSGPEIESRLVEPQVELAQSRLLA
jgi:hypothetical protein